MFSVLSMARSIMVGLVLTVLIVSAADVFAQVRSSSNYQLQSDSINIGGGFASSTNYQQESTVGEVATGESNSSSYQLRAGYQQMQEVFISMTAAANVVMSPDLPGLSGGTSNGTTSVTVTTDSPAGYSLSISAEDTPAMKSGANSITDYPASTTPDYTFTVGTTEAYFGYSVISADVVSRFRDNGTDSCNAGVQNNYDTCWRGLSVSDVVVAQSTSSNHPSGTATDLRFKVGLGGNNAIPSGLYTATTTLTALPL